MVLERLSLVGFRNLSEMEIMLAPERNLISGVNGAGKTNLLEAVYYLAMGKSFRKAGDGELLQFNARFFRLEGTAQHRAVLFYSADEKKIMLDGRPIRKLSDFIGWMPIVIFSFDDIWLVRGEPRQRRDYLDTAIAKMSRHYLVNLVEYRRILRQRNRILEEIRDHKISWDDKAGRLLESFDESLVLYGNEVYEERKTHFGGLAQGVADFCAQMDLPQISIAYRASVPDQLMTAEFLQKRRAQEIACGRTVFGPHRDELLVLKAGRPLKTFGSEGEQRVVALAMRLAEMTSLERARREASIKLLDEAVSELDRRRLASFLENLQGQVLFATTREINDFGKHFFITDGFVKETN